MSPLRSTGKVQHYMEENDQCAFEGAEEPCAIVIFGATGDLTARKLFPSLFNLYRTGGMPDNFVILGAARSDMNDDEFRKRMRKALKESDVDTGDDWKFIEERLFYHSLDFDSPAGFEGLADRLAELDEARNIGGNKLFYLALPPKAYIPVSEGIGKAGLSRENENGNGWVRFVVEKPFGHDLQSARELDASLHRSFHEHQIFRIDHYLAKETVQNVTMLRFANSIFEPIWNRRYIEFVQITAAESIGVEHRAGYYDQAGVLRDMFQNHMMQLLSLSAMDPPSKYEADRVRDEKTRLYRALKPFPLDDVDSHLVLGQYAAGVVDGKPVPPYVEEPGVAPDSLTPTYACMKVFIDNWRWQGVPFYMTSGKRLSEKRTEIAIQFKEVPYSMFRSILGEHITANRLVLGIQPKEEVRLEFQAKTPGSKICLRTVTMNFDYHGGFDGPKLDAYEKVLLDVMLGDHTLFWRQDSVDLCWSFLTPILEQCYSPEQLHRLHLYRAGTWGPAATQKLMPRGLDDV